MLSALSLENLEFSLLILFPINCQNNMLKRFVHYTRVDSTCNKKAFNRVSQVITKQEAGFLLL